MNYKVEWQRVFPETITFKTVASCEHRVSGEDDSTRATPVDCSQNFDINDFSLLLTMVEPDRNRTAEFKCIVKLFFQPSSSQLAPEVQDVDTVVIFYGEL